MRNAGETVRYLTKGTVRDKVLAGGVGCHIVFNIVQPRYKYARGRHKLPHFIVMSTVNKFIDAEATAGNGVQMAEMTDFCLCLRLKLRCVRVFGV